MTDYETYTSTAFGKGQANTTAMITKWNNAGYGAKDDNGTYKDVWGQIQTLASKGWFVPSIAEWDAFADAFDVTSEFTDDGDWAYPYGLSGWYWSSSQNGAYSASCVVPGDGHVDSDGPYGYGCVRLSATF